MVSSTHMVILDDSAWQHASRARKADVEGGRRGWKKERYSDRRSLAGTRRAFPSPALPELSQTDHAKLTIAQRSRFLSFLFLLIIHHNSQQPLHTQTLTTFATA